MNTSRPGHASPSEDGRDIGGAATLVSFPFFLNNSFFEIQFLHHLIHLQSIFNIVYIVPRKPIPIKIYDYSSYPVSLAVPRANLVFDSIDLPTLAVSYKSSELWSVTGSFYLTQFFPGPFILSYGFIGFAFLNPLSLIVKVVASFTAFSSCLDT